MLSYINLESIEQKVRNGELMRANSHNLLVYNDEDAIRRIFVSCAKIFLPKNEILLLASQYDTTEAIQVALAEEGLDIHKHLANGTLFIIDAQKGYQDSDPFGTFKLAITLISRARKEGRSGVTWIGDTGSFFSFDRIDTLVEYELFHPKNYHDPIRTLCCYHYDDFSNLEKHKQDILIHHHFKSTVVR